MTDGVPIGPTARFGRRERRGVLLGLSGGQTMLLGGACALLVLGMYARGGAGVLIAAPLWIPLAAVALVTSRGRTLVVWLPILAHWSARRLTGQTEYRIKIARPRLVGQLTLPGDAARMRLLVSPVSNTALIHDRFARTLTCVAAVSAPAFDLVDVDTQHGRVAGWGRLLASLTPATGVARVQVLQRTVPETGVDLASYWAANGVRDGSWAAHVVADLVARAPSRARHEVYVAISLSVPRASALAKSAAAVEQQMAAISAAAGRADLRIECWLDHAALGRLLRTAYDPAAVSTAAPQAGASGLTGPMAISEEWDRLRADGALHAVYWIAEWPRDEVTAGFLRPLTFATATHALSITAKPQPTATALRDIRKAKADHHTDAAQRARIGQLADEAMNTEANDVAERERELAAGHTVLDFTGLLTVTATNADELDAACAELEIAAGQAGCELRRLVGQQAQAFAAAALPLCRGLR